jgi:hypothetical protein
MIVKSTKYVDLRDGTYRGFWVEWLLVIPFDDETMEIPLNRGNTKDLLPVTATVSKNQLSFEVK